MVRKRTHVKWRRRHGFTLVELLVVVLILSILMSVGLPIYLSTVADAQKRVCRTNMQTIGNAVQAARVKVWPPDYGSLITGGVTTLNLPDLQALPVCPAGGTYSLAVGSSGDTTTFKVQCNILGHKTYEPGIDSQ